MRQVLAVYSLGAYLSSFASAQFIEPPIQGNSFDFSKDPIYTVGSTIPIQWDPPPWSPYELILYQLDVKAGAFYKDSQIGSNTWSTTSPSVNWIVAPTLSLSVSNIFFFHLINDTDAYSSTYIESHYFNITAAATTTSTTSSTTASTSTTSTLGPVTVTDSAASTTSTASSTASQTPTPSNNGTAIGVGVGVGVGVLAIAAGVAAWWFLRRRRRAAAAAATEGPPGAAWSSNNQQQPWEKGAVGAATQGYQPYEAKAQGPIHPAQGHYAPNSYVPAQELDAARQQQRYELGDR